MLSILTSLLTLAPGPVRAPVLPGESVVRTAYHQYAGKWFTTATYTQRTHLLLEQRIETWYVALQLPGLTRIDVAPGATGRAILYRNDSTYEFGHGQLRAATPGVQPLYVLLHDLHSQAPDKTIRMLTHFGFDLRKTHDITWQGQRVIVIGASAGDTTSNQVWLEQKRMVLVRLIEHNAADPRRPLDARVSDYQRAGGGWLEGTVKIFLGGTLTTEQVNSNVRINQPLEPDLFEPVPYHLPRWVQGAKDLFGGLPNMALPGH